MVKIAFPLQIAVLEALLGILFKGWFSFKGLK